jgi:hypothetical protein
MVERLIGEWQQLSSVPAITYRCGYCDATVGPDKGYYSHAGGNPVDARALSVRICPVCNRPTFNEFGTQHPGVPFGDEVSDLPDDVGGLYKEARLAAAAGAHTASVLTCRKLLMHIAVDRQASTDLAFIAYVEYLAQKNYIPPGGHAWVDHVRERGNEANHEIVIMTAADAELLLTFVGMLLKFVYEFPARLPKKTPTP